VEFTVELLNAFPMMMGGRDGGDGLFQFEALGAVNADKAQTSCKLRLDALQGDPFALHTSTHFDNFSIQNPGILHSRPSLLTLLYPSSSRPF
jgi:hypothetical protein